MNYIYTRYCNSVVLCVFVLFKVVFKICSLTFTLVSFVWSVVLQYILNEIRYWVKKTTTVDQNKKQKEKNHGAETTAVNDGQENKLALNHIGSQ